MVQLYVVMIQRGLIKGATLEEQYHKCTEKSYHIVSDFSRYCRKIVRLYNEIVELMLAARYRNRSI